ncbi:MAG TPA: methyltransferase domain-containing protein [Pyrinomonadaceae bacterium]|nr:methyltransferase domain-containing protein [Pyrinomonadaceae bacterium]
MKLRKYLRSGNCATLDAGCGNGAFSYYASSLGNSVLGINIDSEQVRKCEEFRAFLNLDRERCGFKVHNIYDVLSLGQTFDQIICFETLEHLKEDREVLKLFRQVINPDGVLHLCTPRRNRRSYFGEVLSETEDGGHVRFGYELLDLEPMLAAAGFSVNRTDKAMGFFSLKIEELLNRIEMRAGAISQNGRQEILRTLAFLCLYPLTFLDVFSTTHLCIYVQAQSREPT